MEEEQGTWAVIVSYDYFIGGGFSLLIGAAHLVTWLFANTLILK